jgi:hypothetical protein
MATWLPGQGSELHRDQNYFLDFLHGDPFAKIAAGEERLPGIGYETLNALHSGTPGVYSPVDRLLILADVAPYSAAFTQYKEQVGDASQYGSFWENKINEALANRETVVNGMFSYPRFNSAEDLAGLNENIKASGTYKALRKGWDFVTHDILAEIPYIGSKFAPFRTPLERYEKEEIYGSSFADWTRPYETIVRPAVYDMARANPAAAAAKGAVIGALGSYGPLGGQFLNPIVPLRSPNIAIPGFAIAGAAASVFRSLFAGDNFVPSHKQAEIDAVEQMDKIGYLKSRTLQQLALEKGDEKLASAYEKAARRTMVGANSVGSIQSALSGNDKKYFHTFLNTPMSQRSDMLRRLPKHYSEALRRTWDADYNSLEEADAETMEYLKRSGMPSTDSLIWHPSIPRDAMKIKMIEGGINGVSDNLHQFGFYESQSVEVSTRFPDLRYNGSHKLRTNNFAELKQRIIHSMLDYRAPGKTQLSGFSDSARRASMVINHNPAQNDNIFFYVNDLVR